jgi:hypothetical protein
MTTKQAPTVQIMVAIDTIVTQDYVVKKGERLHADHPAVRDHGEFFASDGTPSAEMAERLSRMHYPDAPPPPPPPKPVMMKAKTAFTARVEVDRPVFKGDTFPISDQVVRNNRARFERV